MIPNQLYRILMLGKIKTVLTLQRPTQNSINDIPTIGHECLGWIDKPFRYKKIKKVPKLATEISKTVKIQSPPQKLKQYCIKFSLSIPADRNTRTVSHNRNIGFFLINKIQINKITLMRAYKTAALQLFFYWFKRHSRLVYSMSCMYFKNVVKSLNVQNLLHSQNDRITVF